MQIPSSENEKESRQSFLVVERVPENIKRPSEVNQVQELPVFVVPSKEESVDEERIVYKAIVCYGSVSNNDNAYSDRGGQMTVR